jgi:2-C-methyl-D-erythritol 4-phosphate cytidylyltransferase
MRPEHTKSVIITAGGVGKRMGANIPKQFLEINGLPILMHTINRFVAFDPAIQVVLVLPKDQLDVWKNLCEKHQFELKHEMVVGGKERFHSVKNGLEKVTGQYVAVHDAVRPLVKEKVIQECFDEAIKNEAAVPVIPVKESIRKISGDQSQALLRKDYVIVQTPQCFSVDVLKKSYQKPFDASFTDDASVAESSGYQIRTVPGNEENIKITSPADLKWARLLLNDE